MVFGKKSTTDPLAFPLIRMYTYITTRSVVSHTDGTNERPSRARLVSGGGAQVHGQAMGSLGSRATQRSVAFRSANERNFRGAKGDKGVRPRSQRRHVLPHRPMTWDSWPSTQKRALSRAPLISNYRVGKNEDAMARQSPALGQGKGRHPVDIRTGPVYRSTETDVPNSGWPLWLPWKWA